MARRVLLSIVFIVTLLAGCKRDPSSSDRDGGTPESLETRRERMETEKQQLYGDMKTRLDQLEKQLDDLRADARKTGGEKGRELERRIDGLQKKQFNLRIDLDRIKNASLDVWEDLKPRLRSALNDLTGGVERAISQFRFSEPKEPRNH